MSTENTCEAVTTKLKLIVLVATIVFGMCVGIYRVQTLYPRVDQLEEDVGKLEQEHIVVNGKYDAVMMTLSGVREDVREIRNLLIENLKQGGNK